MRRLSTYTRVIIQLVELQVMLKHVRGLKFDEVPNYDLLHTQIKKIAKNASFELIGNFDWEKVAKPKTK